MSVDVAVLMPAYNADKTLRAAVDSILASTIPCDLYVIDDFSRIPVDTSVVAYLRERFDCNPADFAAERSSWGAYLALGYRLTRLRDRLQGPG